VEWQAQRHWLVERHYELGAAFEYGEALAEQWAELEKLDQQKTEIMAYAERSCRKFRMGKVDFSPKVEEAREQCQVWHLVVKWRQGKKVNPTYI